MAPVPDSLYPVPLTPFEEYMFRDARANYPMTMPLALVFDGRVNRELLSQAFTETLSHEPLMTACVRKYRGRFCWVPSDDFPKIEFKTSHTAFGNESGTELISRIDLDSTPGVQCSCCITPDSFVIRLHIHHAVCDATGCFQFAGNWFARYGQLIGDAEGLDADFPDPAKVMQRTDYRIELPHPLPRTTIWRSFVRETGHWFGRFPLRIPKSSASIENVNNDLPNDNSHTPTQMLWAKMPGEFLDCYPLVAKRRGISLNAQLLGDYFQVLRHWFEETAPTEKKFNRQWLRLLLPTSLKKTCHADFPSVNMLGYAIFDRRFAACVDDPEFYTALHSDLESVKKWSMGAMFLSGVDVCRRIPLALSLVTSSAFCHATSVFTSISNPCGMLKQQRFRENKTIAVGDASLRQIIGGSPVRPKTPLTACLIQQQQTETLALTYDARHLSLFDIAIFRDLFVSQLMKTATS